MRQTGERPAEREIGGLVSILAKERGVESRASWRLTRNSTNHAALTGRRWGVAGLATCGTGAPP